MGPQSRRRYANGFLTEFTDQWWIPESDDSSRCNLTVSIRLPDNWGDSRKCSQGDIWYNDKTLIFADNPHHRQGVRTYLNDYSGSSQDFGYTTHMCYYKAPANNWQAW